MKIIINKALNELDYNALPKHADHLFISNETNPTIIKIINILKEKFQFNIKPESYWRIEHNPKGHKWHVDTGDNNHMPWCQIGCSILLTSTKEFIGGETKYNKEIPITIIRDKFDLLAHTSDEWHMINPHTGNRVVLLLFI
jgi:hypothetical protein